VQLICGTLAVQESVGVESSVAEGGTHLVVGVAHPAHARNGERDVACQSRLEPDPFPPIEI